MQLGVESHTQLFYREIAAIAILHLYGRGLDAVAWKKSVGHTTLTGGTSIILLQVAPQLSKVALLPATLKTDLHVIWWSLNSVH